MAVKLGYFAWQGQVYECEVLHYVMRDDVAPPRWYAAVRPSVTQRTWIGTSDANGCAAVPANVVRETRAEAETDLVVGTLRKFAKSTNVEELTKPLQIGSRETDK